MLTKLEDVSGDQSVLLLPEPGLGHALALLDGLVAHRPSLDPLAELHQSTISVSFRFPAGFLSLVPDGGADLEMTESEVQPARLQKLLPLSLGVSW